MVVAENENEIYGFISITPPKSPKFSIDKYFSRACIPYSFDQYLYEIRLLTVRKQYRKTSLALLLMYAAMLWVQSHGGKYIVAICRSDLMKMYEKAGLQSLNQSEKSGAVIYELAVTSMYILNVITKNNTVKELKNTIIWNLPYNYDVPSTCYHGGRFFEAIGEDLQTLENRKQVINADVLDAWFPPSPKVVEALQRDLPWILQTSPPTHAEGLLTLLQKFGALHQIMYFQVLDHQI